jgi:hypothetical protein
MTQDTNTASGAAEPNLHTIQAKLIAAQNCHPNAVQILIGEALNAIDTVARAALASTPEQPVAGPANAIPAAHVDNAPFGFTEQEKGAWSVGYEAGASHGQAPADLSPTAGMNIAQRILHVGGRNNDAGYVEFGSIQAVEALVRQVLRDLPAPATADSVQEDAARYRWLREGNDANHGAAWHVAVNLYGCEWDAAIDAAMNKVATP